MNTKNQIQLMFAATLICCGVMGVVVAETGPTAPAYGICVKTGTITNDGEETHQDRSGAGGHYCKINQMPDNRCTGNPRPQCKVDCDDHCASCFGAAAAWVKWSQGPGCIGDCTFDVASISTCRDCKTTGARVCAVGDVYNAATCAAPNGTKAWDTAGDNCL